MMGLKDWWSGSKPEEPAPMTIQQFEQLLTKRRGKETGNITLIVDGIHYAVIKQTDHDRLIRLADAIEHLVKALTDEGR